MSQLAPTLHRFVTEETGQSFYGLFVYDGNHVKPPPNSDPMLKLMQLRDSWIAFSDDREIADCNKCAPPFVECDEGVRFCHLRFPLNAQGTAHAVQTLLDMLRAPATAFIVAYTANDLTDDNSNNATQGKDVASGMNARSIMRFALNQGKESNESSGGKAAAKEGEETEEEAKRKKIQLWTVAGFVIVGMIAVIVGVAMLMKKKNCCSEGGKKTLAESREKKQQSSSSKRQQSAPATVSAEK